MENYIDLGIDFGAENIVVVATGKDNRGRPDYKLVNLDGSGSLKNYLGAKKITDQLEIGSKAKISYIYHDADNDYHWLEGRYKSFIGQKERPFFSLSPEELLKFGLEKVISEIENFDFRPLLSGKLRNLAVGVPQNWSTEQKNIYLEALNSWKHGKVSLLSEPVAATIAANQRSIAQIGENIIMIMDLGASTFDICFALINEKSKIYKTIYRSNFAGHYFDLVFAAFTLFAENNKSAARKLIELRDFLRFRKIEDLIVYLQNRQSQYASFLLEIEMIKENHLFEITKFNRNKLIDPGNSFSLQVNKKIYNEALEYYSEKLAKEINQIITDFKKNESLKTDSLIFPFFCGGASALSGLEKKIREKIFPDEGKRLFSISRDGLAGKIDTTIAIGLAYYAHNPTLVVNNLEFSIGISFRNENDQETDYWLFLNGEKYPLSEDKKFSDLLDSELTLQYFPDANQELVMNFIYREAGGEEIIRQKETFFADFFPGDHFDLHFNLESDELINLTIINLTQNKIIKKNIELKR